jgi:ABC-2 type transport system permease protein
MAAGISLNRLLASGIGYHQAMIEISPINVQSHIISNPYLNYGYYLAPVFMFMAIVIFTVLSTIYAFGRELRYATAKEWLSAANGSMWGAIIGKALPITIVMTIFTQVIFAILFVFMGMECTGSYLIITLGSILFIIAYQSIAILIITLTANQRLALSLGGGYAVMAFTFSGITFPTTAMFGVAKVISTIFPLGYFVQIFINEAMRGAPTEYSIKYLIAISLFILPIFIVKRRLKRISLDDRYWSRD